jgi:hypothetical protein
MGGGRRPKSDDSVALLFPLWLLLGQLFVQVTETRKRVPDDEHPETLTGINNLTFTLREQGSLSREIP